MYGRTAALLATAVTVVGSPTLTFGADAPAARYAPAMNYLLHCQGCHQADGSGQPGYIPDFRDSVARFLALPEGRAYLGRVPGTSQSLLNDQERAEVLNWIVTTFDPVHLPRDFSPYTAAELARYRKEPISRGTAERARLLALLDVAPRADARGPGR